MMSITTSHRTNNHNHNRSGPPGDHAEHIPRWRRLLAAAAVAALSFSGVGLLGLAPAAADEPTVVSCVEPQILDVDGVTCIDPPAEEVVEETPIETPACVEPQVLDIDGVTCIDPPAEEVVEETTACVEPQILDVDGVTCIDPPAEESTSKLTEEIVVQVAPEKIQFCHRTAADSNPYVYVDTSINAFFHAGHIDHTGPVWPAVGPDGKWGDVYPPNQYDADGQNWGAGSQDFLDNGCSDEPSDNPGIAIDAESCQYYEGSGWANFWATNTDSKFFYELLLDDDVVDDGWGDEDISYWNDLEPGTYTVTVKMYTGDPENEGELISEVSTEFTLDACPVLDITAAPLTCSAATNGTAVLHFSGLIEGEYYEWWVDGPGSSDPAGNFVADGPTRDQNLDTLPPGNYTATVYWEQKQDVLSVAIIIEEPPRHSVTETTTFTITSCPALASTGVDDVSTYVNLGLLLTVLGGIALAVAQQRRDEAPLGGSFL